MTNAKHPGDEMDSASEIDVSDPEVLKLELFTAWSTVHPGGTRQQFDDEWRAITNVTRPSDAAVHAPASEEQDPLVIKRRMFEEWRALRPDGTHAQFEAEWQTITSIRGV